MEVKGNNVMNRERNEKCSWRWVGKDGWQNVGGRECDAPIWVTREKTYVAAYEGYALRRVQLDLGKSVEEKGREVKYRKKNEKEARSQWWWRKKEWQREKGEGANFTIPWGETFSTV